MILSAHAESIILSVGGAKQQSTKSCSGKCGNDGGGRCNSGGGDGSNCDNDCSDDSTSDGDGDGDSGNGDSGGNNSNSNSGGGNIDNSGKSNNQLKAAVEKAATVVNGAFASILLAS
jgi:hypothetical protein